MTARYRSPTRSTSLVPSVSGRVILAAAGSGKTTWIVRQIAARKEVRTAVTTFTVLNAERIVSKIWAELGGINKGVCIQPWFSFLLRDLVRPYQNYGGRISRIGNVHFASGQSTQGIPKSSSKYWFDSNGYIYTDKISEFALLCDDKSKGAVFRRFAQLYEHVYIDEVQDLASYDLDLVERMMTLGIAVTMVGDPRQATYSTSHGNRNRRYRRQGIQEKFQEWATRKLCQVMTLNHSYRCSPEICKLADRLYPSYGAIDSRNKHQTDHDGVVIVRTPHIMEYINRYHPQILRYDKNAESFGQDGLNFGNSKGLEFERVLIVPTGPIRRWLSSGDRNAVESSLAKLYVAITRAKQSVAFVHDGDLGLGDPVREWAP